MIKIEWCEYWIGDGFGYDLVVDGTCITHLIHIPGKGWEIFGGVYRKEYDDLKDTLKSILKNQKDINSLPNDDVSKKKVMDFIESIIRLELA